MENTSVTTGQCGGNLSAGNSTMTGDVHTSSLAVSEATRTGIKIFPNPVSDVILVSGIENAKNVQIYNMTGQLVLSETFDKKINVSQIVPGIYVLRIVTNDSQILEFKFMKK